MTLIKKILPRQQLGTKTGATAELDAGDKINAKKLFNSAKYRLLDINHWQTLCGGKGAQFQLTDENGINLHSPVPEIGNLIRIKLPTLPNSKGDGYDWVRIEKFEDLKDHSKEEELYGFRVRPVSGPHGSSGHSTHFYTSAATSTFLIYRKGSKVFAMERGRNELPNTKGSFLNKLRNFLVAIPAMLGLSKPQWKRLVNGILGIG